MAGAAEVLALSDDEDTPRSKFKPPSRAGTRLCTPITPGNVVCLDSDDELEVRRNPVVSAKVSWGGTFLELDDCSIVSVTPASSKVDCLDDCSIVKEVPSSSKRVSLRMSDTSVHRPDPCASQILTDWTPDWSQDWTPEVEVEVEEPQPKRQKITDASPLSSDVDVETGHDDEEDPCSVGAQRLCDDLPPTCDFDTTLQTGHDNEGHPSRVGAQSASRGQKLSEEERQRRLREKEVEFERKQAERAEKKREKEEAKRAQQEENRKKKEDEKARKAAAKKAAQERRKNEQEVAKFKGKEALKQMKASVDVKIIEKGLIGGELLRSFGQKNLKLECVQNSLENSITWRTKRPTLDSLEILSQDTELGSQDGTPSSQVVHEDVDIQYLLFVFEAEEFARMVAESSLFSHVRKAQRHYPGYTICYVVNSLMSFLRKKDQEQYQAPNPANIGWQRPPVEKALAGLMTNFTGVHSRLCVDEADIADHVTGIMPVLADAYYKPKLTKLLVSKNGDHVKDDAFEEIRQSLWLKALVAIPKVSGPCAVSIGRMYPTMRSLLNIYLDKERTDREKELLLQDLQRENVFGDSGKKIGLVCSRKIFHVLMAQDGNLKVDNIEQED